MQTQSPDTPGQFEEVWIEKIRQAGVAQRLALACSLSQTAIQLSRRAIQRSHPDWPARRVLLEFVELHYGRTLADALQALWEQPSR
ncbi:MAG TPA: hypothetical protein PK054_07320 [Anaerohalosphaeraceae bacterium]|nr:hypothetical protein [Anaerohalosphaeraceae bacterium]HOL88570.1 hypothetical protein [Anaerohalosphaeraceae bacterium]HPP56376.1 hypothetical protein [Anaerohalosphaeraceae bacterium]